MKNVRHQTSKHQRCRSLLARHIADALGRQLRQKAAVQFLDGLTPGDFAAALKRLKLSAQQPTAAALCKALAAEVRVKRQGKGPIGFV